MPADPDSVLYLVARHGPAELATVLRGVAPGEPDNAVLPRKVVVNERSTVATGFALAQFLEGRTVAGNTVGVRNAAAMVGNMVDRQSGEVAPVLAKPPNGDATETLATFNSLANMVANCIAARPTCFGLLDAARGRLDRLPLGTLHAIAAIARNPWRHVDELYRVATLRPATYTPALATPPNAWTIALKFQGDGNINGPGNFAFDAQGTAWVANNYTPGGATDQVCAGQTVYRFTPTGRLYPGAPYAGGGVSGVGYGITSDPAGRIWLGNFGFESDACSKTPAAAPHNSVSLFDAQGNALSPDITGYTAGRISWPQGTVSDRDGNIWIANCGNDSVTLYPGGDPRRARNIGRARLGLGKPFDIAIDPRGQAWVTGNDSSSVAVIGRRRVWTIDGDAFDRPMGIAGDSRGNMWVANSGVVDVPCPDGGKAPGSEFGGSITLIGANGAIARGAPFTGGGIAIPWGITVDGADQVWVANFGSGLAEGGSAEVRISQFCGTNVAACPPGLRTGDPISPKTGYTNRGLTRITAVAVDPSGNVWAANNWKIAALPNNPGGDAIMIFVGLATPLKAPLIGPPEPPDSLPYRLFRPGARHQKFGRKPS
ncbi:Vgb family protein [Geminicoccus roseus]|uniref:Vgb family protein n=1 Tax=Geminicoccus roseus TaxID=404900 RepID=UPI0003FAFEA0|nr:hypothetical protein [Geminicoccus roseus]